MYKVKPWSLAVKSSRFWIILIFQVLFLARPLIGLASGRRVTGFQGAGGGRCHVFASPAGQALVVVVERVGLVYPPLSHE